MLFLQGPPHLFPSTHCTQLERGWGWGGGAAMNGKPTLRSHSCGLVGGPASLSPHQHSLPCRQVPQPSSKVSLTYCSPAYFLPRPWQASMHFVGVLFGSL